eukprot:75049-Chlamydomonas_euryale.AAC.3
MPSPSRPAQAPAQAQAPAPAGEQPKRSLLHQYRLDPFSDGSPPPGDVENWWPWRKVGLAALLLVIGTALLSTGLGLFLTGNQNGELGCARGGGGTADGICTRGPNESPCRNRPGWLALARPRVAYVRILADLIACLRACAPPRMILCMCACVCACACTFEHVHPYVATCMHVLALANGCMHACMLAVGPAKA